MDRGILSHDGLNRNLLALNDPGTPVQVILFALPDFYDNLPLNSIPTRGLLL
jgi:hypothetical protein